MYIHGGSCFGRSIINMKEMLVFNAKPAIFSLIMARTSYISMKCW
jgi:hypothetical protein